MSLNPDEINDINFVLHDLQYSSILDVPFHIRIMHQLYTFFGKINTSISAPIVLGYFYYIILILQSFLPSLLIDCQDIWSKNSIVTMILNVICYFYQGPHAPIKSYRVIVSILISAIFILLFIILIIRARHYQKVGRVSSSETKFFYFTFKYIMALFCPHIIAGVGISFDQIINQNRIDYNVLCIIISIFSLISYLYLNYIVVSPRVLFEDTPTHDWFPLLSLSSIINTTLLSLISGIAGCLEGKKRMGCSVCMMVLSLLIGAFFFLSNGIVKVTINSISSATSFGAAFSSLFITIIFAISKKISTEVIFIVSIVACIAFIIIVRLLKQMKIGKMLMFFECLLNSEEIMNEIFANKYKNPYSFLSDMTSSIEMWHPAITNFEIFEFAVSKWPNNFSLLLFYARILMIFPSKNQKMIEIASKIAALPEKSTHISYLYQFSHFTKSRQISATPIFRGKFDEIVSHTDVTKNIIKRFWENILQKNISNFWNESDNVISSVSELNSLYLQLIDDYTNNLQLLKSYCDFVQNIKHDTNEAAEAFKKIEILKKNGNINDSDLALKIALQVFPNLNNCIEAYEESELAMNNSVNDESKSNIIDQYNPIEDSNVSNENNPKTNPESDFQFEMLLNDLTSHSKLGRIWIECIILVVMTVVSLVLFYFYYDYYITHFAKKQENLLKFLIDVNMLMNEFTTLSANMNILPLVLLNQTVTQISILNFSEFTANVAPVLYENGRIPDFSLSSDKMVDKLSNVRNKLSQTISKLSSLDKNDQMVEELSNLFYKITGNNTDSFKDIAINQLLIAQEMLKFTNTTQFFNENDYYNLFTKNTNIIIELLYSIANISHQYCSFSYDQYLSRLNLIMIIMVLVTLLLLTLPYLIQLFILINQADSIANSFTLFPKTEIRAIINKYGESSKLSDVEQVDLISDVKSKNSMSIVASVLIFIASFVAIIACSLAIYFTAVDFIDKAESISSEVNTLVPPFASLTLAFSQLFRLYMLTHDGTNPYNSHIQYLDQNVYYSGSDNLSYLLGNASITLSTVKIKIASDMYGLQGGLGAFYKKQERSFDYFKEEFYVDTQDIAIKKSFFEVLASCVYTEAIHHISDFFNAYFFEVNYVYQYSLQYPYVLSQLGVEVPEMPSLIYWFSEFGEENRTKIYFQLVENDALSKITSYKSIGSICFYVVIAWQIVTCIVMLIYLINRHYNIRKSLYFYNFFKPEVIIQNQRALQLIESGQIESDEEGKEIFSSESIFSKISQGCVIISKDFKIMNYNNSFITLFKINENNLNGKNFLDFISKNDQDKSCDQFILHVNSAIAGKYKTNFTDDFSVKLLSGEIMHFRCNVLCITPIGIANENEITKIDKIAFVFDENTETFIRKQQIEKETTHLNEMLSNVMPSRIVKSFMSSNDCISFIVQSVTIGSIRIKVLKDFDPSTTDEFIVYNKIFKLFDEEIKEFDLLSKLNSFSHTYTFIGGLFSEVNKPERHAEESIKFALNLLKITPELSKKIGAEIQLTAGVHIGGPIVAGVINFEKPTFQIIGTVKEMANQMKSKGLPQTICISRAVYELIFSAGFNVQEQGDTTIKGGKVIPTYLVRL